MASDNTGDYEVGNCKPPKHAQFQKGKSGNPKGRPKGSRNTATTSRRIQQEMIFITERGKKRKVTRMEGLLRKLWNDALTGDRHAVKMIILLDKEFDAMFPVNGEADPSVQRDSSVLDSIILRIHAMAGESEQTKSKVPPAPKLTDPKEDDDEYSNWIR